MGYFRAVISIKWKLSLEMKHGAFNTILKVYSKVCNGNRQHPYNPGNLVCQNHKWRYCLSLSLISKVFFTFDFIPQGQTDNKAY